MSRSRGMLVDAGSSQRDPLSLTRQLTPAETPTNRTHEHRGAGRLQVDDFMFSHALGCVGLMLFTLVWLRSVNAPLGFALLGLAAVLMLYGRVHARWHHRVRIHVRGKRVRVSSPWRRIDLTPERTLHVCASRGVLSLLLVDGRLLTLGALNQETQERVTRALEDHVEPHKTFVLRGIPGLSRRTRALSRLPLMGRATRTRLVVGTHELRLECGPWSRRYPLSTLVRVSATSGGVELGFANATSAEIVTFAGSAVAWHPRIYTFNQLVAQSIERTRRRALAAALDGYRGRRK